MNMENNLKKCCECGRKFEEPNLMILKRNNKVVYICKDCKEELGLKTSLEYLEDIKSTMLKPSEMTKRISKYVIGQEDAMKTLAVEIRKHFLRITSTSEEMAKSKKNNILLLGPTASGKSYMVEKFAEELNLPFASIDINTVSPTGYAGGDINSVLLKLIKKAKNEFMAERGIVFIDEFDKIIEHKTNDSVDVRGKMLQQSILKFLEGDVVELTEQVSPGMVFKTQIDTSNILFICAGAFVGIEDNIKQRLKISNEKTMGFISKAVSEDTDEDDNKYRKMVTAEDLINYGFIPEIVGRVPIVLTLDKLSLDQMVEVLKAKNGIIEEYVNLFKAENKSLKFDENALKTLAKIAHSSKIGARGLRTMMAKVTNDIFFNISDYKKKTIVITSSMIKESLSSFNVDRIDFEENLSENKSSCL